MRLLRRRSGPRTTTIRPAERYLMTAAEEARRLGCSYVGTEHLLLALTRDPGGGAARVLRQFDLTYGDIAETSCVGEPSAPKIDADALAALGIDFDAVRERLEATFGRGALEQTGAGCLGVMPRLKMALAYAVQEAGEQPVQDEHVLLGMLRVRDSLAAHILRELEGVSFEAIAAMIRKDGR